MKHYGLIGYPLGHSFSKIYFEEKFAREGIRDAAYELIPLKSIQSLQEMLLTNPLLCGFNVTIPHKQSIIPLLHELDPVAREIGAVNCVKIADGQMTGFNTDAIGFERSILPFLENRFERALILGTGGSAQAVSYVFRKRGIDTWFASTSAQGDHILSYEGLDRTAMDHFRLIVNCTPVGMYPRVEELPALPYDGISSHHLLYDLIYNPDLTAFLREGQQRGAQIINGKRMLELQAEASWEIWNS